MYNKRAADPVHPDLDGLLVKNKNLLAEVYGLSENKTLWESIPFIKVEEKILITGSKYHLNSVLLFSHY